MVAVGGCGGTGAAVIGGYRNRSSRAAVRYRRAATTVATPTPAPATPARVAHVVALTLTASVRSLDTTPTLEIPPGTTEVKVTLRLEPDGRDRYDVAVRELAANGVAWRADAQAASGDDPNRTLVISIPASTFRNGRYLIRVSAGSASNQEIVATYPFSVVLQ